MNVIVMRHEEMKVVSRACQIFLLLVASFIFVCDVVRLFKPNSAMAEISKLFGVHGMLALAGAIIIEMSIRFKALKETKE